MKQIVTSFFLILIFAISVPADPIFRINNGNNQDILKFNICRTISNASGKDIMVPTNTSGEWSAFLAALPTGVTATALTCCTCPNSSVVVLGAACSGGGICAGTYSGTKYMVTPGGCTDSDTPTCAGGADTVHKTWKGSLGTNYNIDDVENVSLAATASSVLGDVNSNAIVTDPDAHITDDSAAYYCTEMNYGGYTDWYLPSKSELTYLFCNSNKSGSRTAGNPAEQTNCAGAYNGPSTKLTGFSNAYWSSTECGSAGCNFGFDTAWDMNFTDGLISADDKQESYLVRCIRKY
jgi:hypothetical protein